jgi:LemA protein
MSDVLLWGVLAAAGLLVLGAAVIFNRLVGLRNRAAGAWSDIDVQLKRRHDLVGNLVETVTAYADHEKTVLEEVTRIRGRAESARSTGDAARAGDAENVLGGGVRRLLAVAEAYPDLKASDRFTDLQRGLTELEDDLQHARRYYNAVVRDYNTRIESVPDMFVAMPLGFRGRAFFTLDDRFEAAAPVVSLGEP